MYVLWVVRNLLRSSFFCSSFHWVSQRGVCTASPNAPMIVIGINQQLQKVLIKVKSRPVIAVLHTHINRVDNVNDVIDRS